MSDYIRRDDAIETMQIYMKDISDKFPKRKNRIWAMRIDLYAQLVLIPASDVRENVRGEWIINGQTAYTCSNCSAIYSFGNSYRFCPWCGAQMGGVEDE